MSQVGSTSTVMVERAGCPEANPWGLSECGSKVDRLVWDQDRKIHVGSSPTAPTNLALPRLEMTSARVVSGEKPLRSKLEGPVTPSNLHSIRLSGIGHHPFKVVTWVRAPYGVPVSFVFFLGYPC